MIPLKNSNYLRSSQPNTQHRVNFSIWVKTPAVEKKRGATPGDPVARNDGEGGGFGLSVLSFHSVTMGSRVNIMLLLFGYEGVHLLLAWVL